MSAGVLPAGSRSGVFVRRPSWPFAAMPPPGRSPTPSERRPVSTRALPPPLPRHITPMLISPLSQHAFRRLRDRTDAAAQQQTQACRRPRNRDPLRVDPSTLALLRGCGQLRGPRTCERRGPGPDVESARPSLGRAEPPLLNSAVRAILEHLQECPADPLPEWAGRHRDAVVLPVEDRPNHPHLALTVRGGVVEENRRIVDDRFDLRPVQEPVGGVDGVDLDPGQLKRREIVG